MTTYPYPKCNNCMSLLTSLGVAGNTLEETRKNFKKWSIKNHPEHGGDEHTFKLVSGCFDMVRDMDFCNNPYNKYYDSSSYTKPSTSKHIHKYSKSRRKSGKQSKSRRKSKRKSRSRN